MSDMSFWAGREIHGRLHGAPSGGPRLSIVVPCYNEQDCLDTLHRRVSHAARDAVGDNYEIVYIDDGSRDQTWEILRSYGQNDAHVTALKLSRNHGHQLALSAGLDLCRGDLILIIDADLQDPPELVGAMITQLHAEQADIVYAVRVKREGETFLKRLTAKAFYRLLAHASDGTAIPLDTGDFRLMTRRALDVLCAMPEQSRFIRGMVAWMGFKQVAFPYERDERHAGETGYPFFKMLRLAFDAFTGFSSAPLRLASYAGMALALTSAVLIVYSLVGWFSGRNIPGWTSLTVVVLVMGAMQMFVMGVMGEYIGRLYNQAKNRPLYIVGDVVGGAIATPTLGVVAQAPQFEQVSA